MEHLLSSFVLARKLYELGFLAAKSLPCALQQPALAVAYALRGYQEFHGLKTDAWCGPKTRDSLMAPRMCGLPDFLPIQQPLCKWPTGKITWGLGAVNLPSVSAGDLKDALSLAWSYWAEVAGVQPEYQPNAKTAMITIASAAVDGPSGTLAYAQLPCAGAPGQLQLVLDNSERWVISDAPRPGEIDLVRVVAHELGHTLGMNHIANGNLLAPVYNPQIRKPQPGDVTEMQARYGPAVTPPPVAPANPPPVAPPETEYVIVFPQPVSKITIRRAA